ncbi:MAG: ATP-grasp domain-containing protein [Enterocloster clostridioformis]
MRSYLPQGAFADSKRSRNLCAGIQKPPAGGTFAGPLPGCWESRGCVNMEFIEDRDGVYHMLECNPRFSGGVEFSCLAGYDCVTNHLRCFEGKEIEQ